jgi:hypothetical protein
MADVTITIRGVDRRVAKFGRVASLNYLRLPMTRAVARIHDMIKIYPPPIPKSRYKRTGVYGKLWTKDVDITSEGLQGKVGIQLHYAPYVGSSLLQARVHRGRWLTDRQVVQRNRAAIVRDFQSAIRRALRG